VSILVKRTTSAKLSFASHSPLKRTSVFARSSTRNACSAKRCALASSSSSASTGRSDERPEGSPIRAV
jgi:hypothetical protein